MLGRKPGSSSLDSLSLDEESRAIVENCLQSSSALIQTAFAEEKAFRAATVREIKSFQEQIKKKAEKEEFKPTAEKTKILAQLKNDEVTINELNKLFRSSKDSLPEPLVTNKLGAFEDDGQKHRGILAEAHGFLNTNFNSFVNAEEISNYRLNYNSVTVLGSQEGINGNSKATFYKTALLITTGSLLELSFDNFPSPSDSPWLETTPLAHFVSVPATVAKEWKGTTQFLVEDRLVYPHSGYAFGGHSDNKVYGPEDCATWIGKKCLQKETCTFDLYNAYKNISPLPRLTPVEVKDPQKDIKPGDIYIHRFFSCPQDKGKTAGDSGHTMLVLGTRNNGKEVLTLGYSRHMPIVEGFGLKYYSTLSDEHTDVGFLRPTLV